MSAGDQHPWALLRHRHRVLEVRCEAGLRRLGRPNRAQALAMLMQTPADTLFRRGFRARAPRRGSD